MIENLEREMREMREEESVKLIGESGEKKGGMMSEKWRKGHEERMRNVGVVRGERGEGGGDAGAKISEGEGRETSEPKVKVKVKEQKSGLGDGWEW